MHHLLSSIAAVLVVVPALSAASQDAPEMPSDDSSLETHEDAQALKEADKADEHDAASRIVRLREPSGEGITSMPGREGPLYRSGDVSTDTKLPVGYPRPTPPGAIEVKHYPSVRQAEVSGEGPLVRSGRVGFMPLFRHIQRSGIAMTAPVEMRLESDDGSAEQTGWTMAFLYHTPEDGPTGEDGSVTVLDTEPVTVIALGVQGGGDAGNVSAAADELAAFLDKDDRWEPSGEVRVLGYNGPYVPNANKWWEVQIPVVASEGASETETKAEPL